MKPAERIDFLAFMLFLLCAWGAEAQIVNGCMKGPCTKGGSPPAGYTGPGDVTSGFADWGGFRAYTSAFAATQGPIATVVDVANAANSCILYVGTNGFADMSRLSCVGNTVSVTTFCTVTHASCRVTKLYNQVASGNDWDQATLANMPDFVISPTGITAGKVGMTCSSARSTLMITGSSAGLSQPYTVSMVANRTTTQASIRGGLMFTSGGAVRLGYSSNANTFFQYAGGALNDFGTSSNNAWYGLQGVFDGASSLINVNGTNTATNNPGTTGTSSNIGICSSSSGDFMDGYILEIGTKAGSVGAIGANQQSAWGY